MTLKKIEAGSVQKKILVLPKIFKPLNNPLCVVMRIMRTVAFNKNIPLVVINSDENKYTNPTRQISKMGTFFIPDHMDFHVFLLIFHPCPPRKVLCQAESPLPPATPARRRKRKRKGRIKTPLKLKPWQPFFYRLREQEVAADRAAVDSWMRRE